MRIESVILGRDKDVLNAIFPFYAPNAQEVRDVTCNTRKMWKGVNTPFNLRCYDIDPMVNPDVVCSWDKLPDPAASINVIIFDPPHLPPAAASDKSLLQYKGDYGLAKATHMNEMDFFAPFLSETKRVLVEDGLIFAKIKDYVHNHKYRWNLVAFVRACEAAGLCPCDLIIKVDPCGGNLKSGRWKSSYHARNAHCYWVIVRNGKCEPKLSLNQR